MRLVFLSATLLLLSAQALGGVRAMKVLRYKHVAVADAKGRVYAIGGDDEQTGSVERFDPSRGDWEILAPLKQPRDSAAGAVLADGKVYVVGGSFMTEEAEYFLKGVEVYDPEANKWAQPGAIHYARHSLFAAAVGEKFYAIGGDSTVYSSPAPPVIGGWGDGPGLAITEAYDPKTNTSAVMRSLNVRRRSAAAVAVGGKIYVFCGDFSGGLPGMTLPVGVHQAIPARSVEVYDPAENKWTVMETEGLTPRSDFGAALGGDGKIYLTGGYKISQGAITAVESFDPKTGKVEAVKPLPIRRYNHAAVGTPDGKIWVVGGRTMNEKWASKALGTVDVYDPKTGEWTVGEAREEQ